MRRCRQEFIELTQAEIEEILLASFSGTHQVLNVMWPTGAPAYVRLEVATEGQVLKEELPGPRVLSYVEKKQTEEQSLLGSNGGGEARYYDGRPDDGDVPPEIRDAVRPAAPEKPGIIEF